MEPLAPGGGSTAAGTGRCAQRQRPDLTATKQIAANAHLATPLSAAPALGVPTQDHQHRDADDGANLADGRSPPKRGVVAALGQPGQGCTAEQREGSAHPDFAVSGRQPFTEEIGLGPDKSLRYHSRLAAQINAPMPTDSGNCAGRRRGC